MINVNVEVNAKSWRKKIKNPKKYFKKKLNIISKKFNFLKRKKYGFYYIINKFTKYEKT